jgi:hypothetical protein
LNETNAYLGKALLIPFFATITYLKLSRRLIKWLKYTTCDDFIRYLIKL